MFFRKRNIQITIWLFLLVVLSSCGQTTTPTILTGLISTPTGSPIPESALTPTISPLQQTTTPTAYPILTNTLTPVPSFVPVATKFNEQVYLDPEGWYSVNIPVDWQAEDSPNSLGGYYVSWISPSRGCRLTSIPGVTPAAFLEIIENTSADYPQCFLYLKADPEHFDPIAASFEWLE
jgi:hypothetical protein